MKEDSALMQLLRKTTGEEELKRTCTCTYHYDKKKCLEKKDEY
jgi:hypothetical protein